MPSWPCPECGRAMADECACGYVAPTIKPRPAYKPTGSRRHLRVVGLDEEQIATNRAGFELCRRTLQAMEEQT